MSSILHQGRGFETVLVHAMVGVDGQGKPQYNTPVEIVARVVRESVLVPASDGSMVKSIATTWVDADQVLLPKEQDQLEFEDDTLVIVIERMDRKQLGGTLDHVRLRCRTEGV